MTHVELQQLEVLRLVDVEVSQGEREGQKERETEMTQGEKREEGNKKEKKKEERERGEVPRVQFPIGAFSNLFKILNLTTIFLNFHNGLI